MITKIIKRDGTEVAFNTEKIFNAISKANAEVNTEEKLNNVGLQITTQMIVEQLNKFNRAVEVEEIQEIAETALMEMKAYEVAKRYIRYRYDHKLKRESDTDKKVMSLVEYQNEAVKQENSNKNPEIIPTQRDYIAGEISKDITKGVQTIQYQVVTLMTTNGQAPFITVYMDINEAKNNQEQKDLANIIEEVLKQRIQGVKNETGTWITPAFPKLIYALDENNVNIDSEFYYLTELAAQCNAKRMVPDYISNKIERELKNGDTYTCMGCRSFLTPDRTTENYSKCNNWKPGHKYYGRFNQGVVTINLPDVALCSHKDLALFDDILRDRLDNICYPALMARHNRLKGTPSNIAPILWQYGALARLDKDETIDELLYHGYSTISLGYAGLYECVKYMTGESHTAGGKDFAIHVMEILNEHTAKWKADTDIDFSLYGTPLESTTYKFAKCLQKRFGIIEDVTDKNYITNSYHVRVTEPIDAFTKLSFESEFQALSPGGAISYVEVPNMSHNIPAVLSVIRYIYDNIMYAELNTRSDYCHVCGFEGEIKVVEGDGKLVWECPVCRNRDQNKMNVARRTCGYIGTNFWNQGRTQEISERVLHL